MVASSNTFDLGLTVTLNPNTNSKVRDIDVPTFGVWSINVPKVEVVEVDLPEQLTFC